MRVVYQCCANNPAFPITSLIHENLNYLIFALRLQQRQKNAVNLSQTIFKLKEGQTLFTHTY